MPSHLSQALLAYIAREKISGSSLARLVGLDQSTISRACSGQRLAPDTLKALGTSLGRPRDEKLLILAHLHDEIERAGRRPEEFEISSDEGILDTDFSLLVSQAARDPDLAAIIEDLAKMTRSYMRKSGNYHQPDTSPNLIAAEPFPSTSAISADQKKK
jgi:transcriptional regulator with XRE-family HTH domain